MNSFNPVIFLIYEFETKTFLRSRVPEFSLRSRTQVLRPEGVVRKKNEPLKFRKTTAPGVYPGTSSRCNNSNARAVVK